MAKFIPPVGKFVDVTVKVAEDKQLIECAECGEPMMVRAVVLATLSGNPEIFSITQNLQCPACRGLGLISLTSVP